MNGETAQVSFNVQSNAAKDALDQALPRLREMLQEQGIELGQSHVKQDSNGQSQQDQDAQANSGTFESTNHIDQTEQVPSEQVIEQRISNGVLGGVDFYA